MEPKAEENKTPVVKPERNIADSVLARVNQFQKTGELKLPKDYSAENALKFAYLILAEAVDKDQKPVLQVCSKESIANSLLSMVVQGLSPMKKQCYFIAFGGKLQMMRSYMGSVALAKRVGHVKSVIANVIYEKDVFEYRIDGATGLKQILKHEQKFEDIDIGKIKGGYAILYLEDGTSFVEIMTIAQCRKAWQQGAAKGNSGAHTNFTDEMVKKSVTSRACKLFINTSDDAGQYDEQDPPETDQVTATVETEITANANSEEIPFEEIKEEVQPGEQPAAEQGGSGGDNPNPELKF